MENFKKISALELNENVIKLIGKEWMLICAGSIKTKFNMLTASWGGVGWLWERPVSFIFIRPQRYTFEFTEKEEYYTISFFDEKYKDALMLCGTKSGRDIDKVKASGLTPFATENENTAFKEARIVLECKKLFATRLNESDFIIQEIAQKNYPSKDFHQMYIAEIVNVWVKE